MLCSQVWLSDTSGHQGVLTHTLPRPPAGWNDDVRQKPCLLGWWGKSLGSWGFPWPHHQPAYAEACSKGGE